MVFLEVLGIPIRFLGVSWVPKVFQKVLVIPIRCLEVLNVPGTGSDHAGPGDVGGPKEGVPKCPRDHKKGVTGK